MIYEEIESCLLELESKCEEKQENRKGGRGVVLAYESKKKKKEKKMQLSPLAATIMERKNIFTCSYSDLNND